MTTWLSAGSVHPSRLTHGPLAFGLPLPSGDGRTIFAEGWRRSDDSVLTLRDTSLDEMFALELEAPGPQP